MASCMMLMSTVMAPTAMSPPYFSREELKQTEMRLAVDCVMKGQAQGQAGQEHRRHRLQILPAELPLGLGPGEEPQHPQGRHCLRQNGGESRAPDAQVQNKDEDGVQNGVQNGADEHRFHAHGGEALRGDISVHAQGHLHKDGAQRIDFQVTQSVANGVFTGAEGQQ